MDLNKYRVDFDYCSEYMAANGHLLSNCTSGYEVVFAGSPESAKLAAKARAMQSLKKQGCKIIFLDLKDPVRIK